MAILKELSQDNVFEILEEFNSPSGIVDENEREAWEAAKADFLAMQDEIAEAIPMPKE